MYVKDAQHTRGDQKAFLGLVDHVLGPNNVSNVASEAENWLVKTVYQGEKKRWNFEHFVQTHVEQYSIIEG